MPTPKVIVFDVNETLLDLTSLEPLFQRVFGTTTAMREWFAQLILYSEAMTLSGLYTPFGELAVGTMKMVGATSGKTVRAEDIEELKQGLLTMPAHADAAPGLSQLKEAGYRLVTLTNSPPAEPPAPLERAGLADFFERNYSVQDVGRFKPAPETYQRVAQDLGVELSELCMVACHLWDTIGAQAAGCMGALVRRPGNDVLPAEGVPEPDIVATDMTELAEALTIDRR